MLYHCSGLTSWKNPGRNQCHDTNNQCPEFHGSCYHHEATLILLFDSRVISCGRICSLYPISCLRPFIFTFHTCLKILSEGAVRHVGRGGVNRGVGEWRDVVYSTWIYIEIEFSRDILHQIWWFGVVILPCTQPCPHRRRGPLPPKKM